MDFWDLTVLIFRRWKIALPLLLMSIGATVAVGLTAEPDYTMTSYVQFIPAKVSPTDNATNASLRNPWNQLGSATLGQAAIYATQDQGFLDQLKATGHPDNFTLTLTYPNPIVTVEVVGATRDQARETTELVVGRLRGSAESLQRNAGVGDADIIGTQRLDRGQNVVPSTGKVKRAIAAVAAAGLVLTAGGAVGGDAILRRRARKRKALEDGVPPEAPPAPETATAVAGVNGTAVAGANGRGYGGAGRPPVPDEPPLRGAGANGTGQSVLPEAVERTAIIIKRPSPALKAEVPKPRRSPAATYRSSNAQNGVGEGSDDRAEDHDAGPAGTNGDTSADPSDVRVVLQPNWVGGENGGKSS